ncbi:hypothetical protein B0T10DRAFT_463261 [Thelonectria olida]|uniref:Uncharacterized protein n=1 Tax=Thelonectria olida TaxID=1576542 RepID=A0A9P9AKY8_9HYPO|nr:hypothetical protein B0T10DRAFT_463261 [Thelonectria olida]
MSSQASRYVLQDPYFNCRLCYCVCQGLDDARPFLPCDNAKLVAVMQLLDLSGMEPATSGAHGQCGQSYRRSITFRPWSNACSGVLMSPLAVAASQGQIQIVQDLLRGGAPVNESEGSQLDHMSPLEAAIFGQHELVAKQLIECGAVVSRYGPTALHMAAAAGSTELVEFLVEEKCFDINEIRLGRNVISFARSSPFGMSTSMFYCLCRLGARGVPMKDGNFEGLEDLTVTTPFSTPTTSPLLPEDFPLVLETHAGMISKGPIEACLHRRPRFLFEFHQARQLDQKWAESRLLWLNSMINDLVKEGYALDMASIQKLLFRCPRGIPDEFEFL